MAKELTAGTGVSGSGDRWDRRNRGETPGERWKRNYAEILQEVRVAQTGSSLLLVFLLTLAFTNRFLETTQFQRAVYVASVLFGVAANCLLIAPAPFHRLVFRRRLEAQLVRVSNQFALWGVLMLMLAINAALLLILDVVLGTAPAIWITVGSLLWFTTWWYVTPTWHRVAQSRRRQSATIAALAVASEKLRTTNDRPKAPRPPRPPELDRPGPPPPQLSPDPIMAPARLPLIPARPPALASTHQLGYPRGVVPVPFDLPVERAGVTMGFDVTSVRRPYGPSGPYATPVPYDVPRANGGPGLYGGPGPDFRPGNVAAGPNGGAGLNGGLNGAAGPNGGLNGGAGLNGGTRPDTDVTFRGVAARGPASLDNRDAAPAANNGVQPDRMGVNEMGFAEADGNGMAHGRVGVNGMRIAQADGNGMAHGRADGNGMAHGQLGGNGSQYGLVTGASLTPNNGTPSGPTNGGPHHGPAVGTGTPLGQTNGAGPQHGPAAGTEMPPGLPLEAGPRPGQTPSDETAAAAVHGPPAPSGAPAPAADSWAGHHKVVGRARVVPQHGTGPVGPDRPDAAPRHGYPTEYPEGA